MPRRDYKHCYNRLSMTSETEEKAMPFIARAKSPHLQTGRAGIIVILCMWIIIYFWGVTQLVDGLMDWLAYGSTQYVARVAVGVVTTVASSYEGLSLELYNLMFFCYSWTS